MISVIDGGTVQICRESAFAFVEPEIGRIQRLALLQMFSVNEVLLPKKFGGGARDRA
jgi:hypothetical protein